MKRSDRKKRSFKQGAGIAVIHNIWKGSCNVLILNMVAKKLLYRVY